jgi:2-dehydro-3-deoxy-D-arabinonate dehydratase
MVLDLSLCRFGALDGQARLGLIAGDALYDLTASGEAAYASLEAWLRAASGRVDEAIDALSAVATRGRALGPASALQAGDTGMRLLCPLDTQEVWACGVTYEMSREARMRESDQPTIYGRVYDAPRPEIFFKATPHRVVGPGEAVAIRGDSSWDVPEPELALVVTPGLDLVGYTVGNDMSSRSIEGENPLYLPQAKVYDRCCALGPFVRLARDYDATQKPVSLIIWRDGEAAFRGTTDTSRIHRPFSELLHYLGRCNSFPSGAFVVTGTGIVPPDTFSLADGDVVEIAIGGLGTLLNPVVRLAAD